TEGQRRNFMMSTRHTRFQRRLVRIEEVLAKSSRCTSTAPYKQATALHAQVELEAQQELSPEELPLYKSAVAAREKGRFYSLEEDAVMRKFRALRDVVARRHGFFNYGGVLHECIQSRPKAKSAGDIPDVVAILHWGRDNCAHLKRLR